MDERFDAIVVGAGPAGSVASYCLAREGLNVLLIERGDTPGAKNMTGGRLYAHSLQRVIPDFWEEAPVERRVTREMVTFMTEDSAISLDVKSEKLNQFPSFTVLRAEFDSWLAGKAEEAGALLAPGIRVDQLLIQDGKVNGVVCGEDEMLADVVIAADGVNSLLTKKAGLHPELSPKQVATGVKTVIELPCKVIEERFNVSEETGMAQLFVGECTHGLQGGGFLYTNQDSLSLGLVITAEEFAHSKHRLIDMMEDFKMHPAIRPLIEGGKVVEYSAHLVPEGGLGMRLPMMTDGLLVVGDAAGLVLNTGYTVRGMDFAIASGEAAAHAVIAAKKKGDFTKSGLHTYQEQLENSFVLKDLQTYAKAPQFMDNHRIFETYPKMIEEMVLQLFGIDGTPARPLLKTMKSLAKKHGGMWTIAQDAWKGARSL